MAIELTREQIAALDALQAWCDIRLSTQGGYPAQIDGVTIPGYVVAADEDHKTAPSLLIYRWEDLLGWHKKVIAYVKENPDEELSDALCGCGLEDCELGGPADDE
jgi:hypothetical protein